MDTIKVQTPEKSIVSNVWTKVGGTMICGYLHEIVRSGASIIYVTGMYVVSREKVRLYKVEWKGRGWGDAGYKLQSRTFN